MNAPDVSEDIACIFRFEEWAKEESCMKQATNRVLRHASFLKQAAIKSLHNASLHNLCIDIYPVSQINIKLLFFFWLCQYRRLPSVEWYDAW